MALLLSHNGGISGFNQVKLPAEEQLGYSLQRLSPESGGSGRLPLSSHLWNGLGWSLALQLSL